MHFESTPPQLTRRTPAVSNELQICNSVKAALGLQYNLRTERFTFTAPDQPGRIVISEEALLVLISTTLAQKPEMFPITQIHPRRLKRIIRMLRALCADADEGARRGLDRFVENCLVLQPGGDITSTEVYSAYAADALRDGEATLTHYEFHRVLSGVIKQRFNLSKRHTIVRPNLDGRLTKRNGWRGLRLNSDTDDTDDSTLHLATE